MKLNTQDWKEFNIARLCYIDMGNKFDNDKMTHDSPAVNFISRTGNNPSTAVFFMKSDSYYQIIQIIVQQRHIPA